MQLLLAKAQREQTVESSFSEGEYAPLRSAMAKATKLSDGLRSQILAALESDYDDLVRDSGTPPHDNILVTLYTEQAFFDVTQAPSWSGAINDGKLRIPVNGLSSMTPQLAHVLKHELAHSFITKLSGGRCPMWLHEGIAQFVEPRSLSSAGHQLSSLFKAHANSLNVLEGSFMNFATEPRVDVRLTNRPGMPFPISMTAYGMSDIQRILERLSQGNSTEAALRATIYFDYGQPELDLARYLADNTATFDVGADAACPERTSKAALSAKRRVGFGPAPRRV